jgi:ABC-2 type transport system permease protein
MLEQSKFMLGVITLFLAGYWVSFTWAFFEGIHFVQFGVPTLGDLLVSRMFFVLFALIFLMLITSTIIVGYGVLYRNRETEWMLTLPLAHDRIFRWKFIELSLLASWAFLFLSGPLLIAYGMVLKLSPFFFLMVMILYIPFSLLANALGTYGLLSLVRLWHSVWGRRILFLLSMVGIWVLYLLFKPIDVNALREAEIVPLMNLLLKNTRISASPLLPSYWVSSGVIALGERLLLRPFFYFGVTLSYAALIGWLVLRFGGGLFYQNVSRVQDRRLHESVHSNRNYVSWLYLLGKGLTGWMGWIPKSARCLLIKDWIVFWRDTAQWSQVAIFFSLLGFYFLNIRNLKFELDDRFWVSVVAFLNLASLGLILATMTTRFVFPQFSLEGRRLWLIGLAPMNISQTVWCKFWASSMLCGLVTSLLMFFSFSSLQLDHGLRWMIGFTVVMMSLGLSGIGVGMGVLFPNLKQANAAQIVSGFGGTFCLVLSLAYVAIIVILVAIPVHLRYVAKLPIEFGFTSTMGVLYVIVFTVSATAAILPMWLAERKLLRLEF